MLWQRTKKPNADTKMIRCDKDMGGAFGLATSTRDFGSISIDDDERGVGQYQSLTNTFKYEDKLGKSIRHLQRSSSYEKGLGKRFHKLQENISYEDKLGQSFRKLRRSSAGHAGADAADVADSIVVYPFLSAAGSYEGGLGKSFRELQDGISRRETGKRENSSTTAPAADAETPALMVAPHEDRLANSRRDLQWQRILAGRVGAKAADAADSMVAFPCLDTVGSYEEGLGEKFHKLQEEISLRKSGKRENISIATRVADAKTSALVVEAPPSPTSVANVPIDALDKSQKETVGHKTLKSAIGVPSKTVKPKVSSKVDVIETKSNIKQETAQKEATLKEEARTHVTTAPHDEIACSVDSLLLVGFEKDVNMKRNSVAVQHNGRVSICLGEPSKVSKEDTLTTSYPEFDDEASEEGSFDWNVLDPCGGAHDLSLLIDEAVVQTLTHFFPASPATA